MCYDGKIKSEERRVLDHVDGLVKPGTLTALIGVSGADKTTLLDVAREHRPEPRHARVQERGAPHGDDREQGGRHGHELAPDHEREHEAGHHNESGRGRADEREQFPVR